MMIFRTAVSPGLSIKEITDIANAEVTDDTVSSDFGAKVAALISYEDEQSQEADLIAS